MESSDPSVFLTIIAFVVGFSALVFIHEWGHYSVARWFRVRVEAFSIGFGKELFGWTDKNGTRWRFAVIPLGGYVKFYGDKSAASNPDADDLDSIPEEERRDCFHFKPVWQRMLIVAAGPVINLVAAALVFAVFFYAYGVTYAEPIAAKIVPDSAAAEAGLQEGDRIITVDGEAVSRFSDVGSIVQLRPGQTIPILVERGGERQTLFATVGTRWFEDRFENKYPYGMLGVTSPTLEVLKPGPIEALYEGTRQTGTVVDTIFTTLGQMIIGLRSAREMGGPLRIMDMTGVAAEKGLDDLIWFLALISVNLGVINLLPIPVLDGGHLLFYIVEAVKGSPVSKKAQEAGYVAGFALMMLFMVFVTLNDLHSMAL